MPRYAMVDKTVQGVRVSHTQFLNEVVKAVARVEGGARVADLIETLGQEWDPQEQRKFLATTMDNMTRRHVLRRKDGKRGLYEVTPHYNRAGVSVFDAEEKAILDVIRQHGGFCRFRDIMEAFGCRIAGQDGDLIANTGQHSRLLHVIRESKLIRQDFNKRGVYNLPWREVAAEPLRGKWAALIIKTTYLEQCYAIKGEVDDNAWREERDTFFYNVGAVFEKLRKSRNLSIGDMLDNRKVRAATADFVRAAPNEIAVIRQDWFDRTSIEVGKMKEAGAATSAIDEYREGREDELRLKLPEWLYRRFEKGRLGAHMMAPLAFYTTVADHFDCCPAQLSRGVFALLPLTDVRIRPERTRRTAEEIYDIKEQHAAWDRVQRETLYSPIEDEDEEDDLIPSK